MNKTPITLAAQQQSHLPDWHPMVETCAKMERQRDDAWKTLLEIRELFAVDQYFGATVDVLFAQPLKKAEKEIERLLSLLNIKYPSTP